MSAPTSFQFVGPKQQRATKVPDAEWSNREARLRELHGRMTLSQLMEVMKSEGFIATRKQYDYQFRKWGLQKYGLTKTGEEEPRTPSILQSHPPTVLGGEAVVTSSLGRKRPQSTHSIKTSGSGLSSPPPVTNKKAKVDDGDRALDHEHLDLSPAPMASASNSSDTDARDFNVKVGCDSEDPILRSTSSTSNLPVPTCPLSPGGSPTTATTSTGNSGSSNDRTQPTDSLDSLKKQLSLETMQSFEVDENAYVLQLDKAVQLAQSVQQYPESIPLGLLDKTSQRYLLSVADYLYAVLDRKQSFVIYEVLLASEQATNRDLAKPQILSPVLLSCARAAETQSQQRIVQEGLCNRIDTLEDDATSPSGIYLASMLLAQMSVLNLQEEWFTLHQNRELIKFMGCDSGNSSFNVLSYLYRKMDRSGTFFQPLISRYHNPESKGWEAFTRMRPTICQLETVNSGDFIRFICFGWEPEAKTLPRPTTSYRSDPITSVSEYVRSCIQWCIDAIDHTFPGVPVSTVVWSSEEALRPTEDALLDTLTVYNYLHKQWRREWLGFSKTLNSNRKWMNNTHETLGISAAELLVVCCDMVMNNSKSPPTDPYNIHIGSMFSKTRRLSDRDIVTKFLQGLTGSYHGEDLRADDSIISWIIKSILQGDEKRSSIHLHASLIPTESELCKVSRETMASFSMSIDRLSDMERNSLSVSDTRV
ncbi:hypothetical protein PG984_006619 [Apiospora sp. TS-2023a]